MVDTDVDIPSVAEIAGWMRLPVRALDLAEKVAAHAAAARAALRGVYTSVPVGVYCHPETKRAALFLPDATTTADLALVKAALAGALDLPAGGYAWSPATKSGTPEDNGYVKVAYSQALRSAGESLNFFPGRYGPTGVPNHPGPVGAMLASGIVGAGLGYGGGALAEQLLPEKWKRGRLRHTLAAIGGAVGAAPGLVWGLANRSAGRRFNDPAVLAGPAGGLPSPAEKDLNLLSAPPPPAGPPAPAGDGPELPGLPELGPKFAAAIHAAAYGLGDDPEVADFDKQADALSGQFDLPAYSGPMAVDVDALGRTLWETGTDPRTAGLAMGAMAAAAQMPGGRGDAGWVTPVQVANLAARMGGGYLSGAVVGTALSLLTGMSEQGQNRLKQVGMYTALARELIPTLFGG